MRSGLIRHGWQADQQRRAQSVETEFQQRFGQHEAEAADDCKRATYRADGKSPASANFKQYLAQFVALRYPSLEAGVRGPYLLVAAIPLDRA